MNEQTNQDEQPAETIEQRVARLERNVDLLADRLAVIGHPVDLEASPDAT